MKDTATQTIHPKHKRVHRSFYFQPQKYKMLTQVNFTYPKNISFECNKCGLCCGDTKEKTRRILLLQKEAEVISQETSIPIQEFATETNNKPYVYEMKKPNQGKCFFLKNNQCTIYNQRPLICRFYPFELKHSQDQKTHIFSYTQECPTINKGKPMTKKDFQELFLLAKEKIR